MLKKIIKLALCLVLICYNLTVQAAFAVSASSDFSEKDFEYFASDYTDSNIDQDESFDKDLEGETDNKIDKESGDEKFSNHSTKVLIFELGTNHKRSNNQISATKNYSSIILPPPNC